MATEVRFSKVDELRESGQELLLALLNTTPTVSGDRQDDLADHSSAVVWLAANVEDPPGATDLVQLREVRAGLQSVVSGAEAPAVLADVLEQARLAPALSGNSVSWTIQAPAQALVAARVLLAWDWMRENMPGRLRPCANPECSRFFVDRSRNNQARWCSMATCGNRMKARRHYARSKRPNVERAARDQYPDSAHDHDHR